MIVTGKAANLWARFLKSAYREAGFYAEQQIVLRTPIDVGRLRKSIKSQVRGEFPFQYGRVYSDSPYAQPVEEGQTPHWPSYRPIELWVRRKFGLARKKGVKRLLKDITFRVMHSIALVGVRGVYMFGKTFADKTTIGMMEKIFGRWERDFEAELNKK
jgi:hypothetical protein